jgi:hypothetical protein
MSTPSGPRLSLSAIQSAIEAWIVAATGLPAAQVFNVNKKDPRSRSRRTWRCGCAQPLRDNGPAGAAALPTSARAKCWQREWRSMVGQPRRDHRVAAGSRLRIPLRAGLRGAVQLLSKCKDAHCRLPSQLYRVQGGRHVCDRGHDRSLISALRTPGGEGRASMDVRFATSQTAPPTSRAISHPWGWRRSTRPRKHGPHSRPTSTTPPAQEALSGNSTH